MAGDVITLVVRALELPRAEWTDAVSRMFGRIKATLDATLVTANLGHMTRVPGLRTED